jgi:ankyrin repeat protein
MEKSDLSAALDALIQGADINFQNPNAEKSSCLHQALKRKDYAGIEFLIMWSSNLNLIDDLGKTPLHYSTFTQNPRLIWFLLKKGADWKIADQNGKVN